MRKLISLAAIATLLGMLASPVMAGQEESDICEPLKDATKGLYGLCIAYNNTSSESNRARIEQKYENLRQDGDPPLPGAESPCPCWTQAELDGSDGSMALGCTIVEAVEGENGDGAVYVRAQGHQEISEICSEVKAK